MCSHTVYRGVIEELRRMREFMVSRPRAAHIERMEKNALRYAETHKIDSDKLLVAVCAHDIFRDTEPVRLFRIAKVWNLGMSVPERYVPLLLHGKVSAEYLRRRFAVSDGEILDAVAFHTSGIPTSSPIVKAMVIIDTTEIGRNFDGVKKLRELSNESVDAGYEAVIANKILYAIENGLLVLPETVETWNSLKGVV